MMALMHTYTYTLGDADADDDDDDAHACQICWVFQPTYNNSIRVVTTPSIALGDCRMSKIMSCGSIGEDVLEG